MFRCAKETEDTMACRKMVAAVVVAMLGFGGCSSDSGKTLKESCDSLRSKSSSFAGDGSPHGFYTKAAELYGDAAQG